jgi:hypothetical protein
MNIEVYEMLQDLKEISKTLDFNSAGLLTLWIQEREEVEGYKPTLEEIKSLNPAILKWFRKAYPELSVDKK